MKSCLESGLRLSERSYSGLFMASTHKFPVACKCRCTRFREVTDGHVAPIARDLHSVNAPRCCKSVSGCSGSDIWRPFAPVLVTSFRLLLDNGRSVQLAPDAMIHWRPSVRPYVTRRAVMISNYVTPLNVYVALFAAAAASGPRAIPGNVCITHSISRRNKRLNAFGEDARLRPEYYRLVS